MSRRRKLTEAEEALWRKVADTTDPLHPERKGQTKKRPPMAVEPRIAEPELPTLSPFRIGERAQTALSRGMPRASAPTMDAKAFGRLKRGKLTPEARIDLHGMTVAQAQPVLRRFVLNAHAQGLRLVLVITGKGRDRGDTGPIPERKGVLKHSVPDWLRGGALGPVVLEIVPAHIRHGGGGAYYVYLRRNR